MRSDFSKSTKRAAYERSQGKCEICRLPLGARRPEYHHDLEAALGGDNSIGNAVVCCSPCHRAITSGHSVPIIAKSNRVITKARIRKRSSFRGWKDFKGQPVKNPRAG